MHYKCILQSSEKTVKINVKLRQYANLHLFRKVEVPDDKQALSVNVCIITLAN